jgi:hypothetical protein
MWNGVSKNLFFILILKKVRLSLVKSATKINFAEKKNFSGTWLIFQLAKKLLA